MNEKITIVSGLPRSGTSMMMKMLEAGGMEPVVDNIRKPDIDNPKGYYEFERVKKIHEDASWLGDTRGKVFKMVAMLLEHLPPVYPYDIVFMVRNMDEMLASQAKMLARLGTTGGNVGDEKMARIFSDQLDKIRGWLDRQPNMNVLYVDYATVLNDPLQQARRIAAFSGQKLDVESMAQVVDPALYRNKARKQ